MPVRLAGSTSQQVIIRILDDPTGVPELGITSTVLSMYWWRRGLALSVFDITSTLQGLASAFDASGITSIINGYYRVDVPNSAFSTGASGVFIGGKGTSIVVIGQDFDLVDDDLNALGVSLDSILTQLGVLSNFNSQILEDTNSTLASQLGVLSNFLSQILEDTNSTLQSQLGVLSNFMSAVLEDTNSTLNSALGVIDANVDAILADTGTDGVLIADAAIGTDQFAAGAIDDAAFAAESAIATQVKNTVIESEGSYTIQQALSIILAAVAGVTADSGATIKTPNGNATRIAAVINGSQERTTMVLTPSS